MEFFRQEMEWFRVFDVVVTPVLTPASAGWTVHHLCPGVPANHAMSGLLLGCGATSTFKNTWDAGITPGSTTCITQQFVAFIPATNQVQYKIAGAYQKGVATLMPHNAFVLNPRFAPHYQVDPFQAPLSPYPPFVPLPLVPANWPWAFPQQTHGGYSIYPDGDPGSPPVPVTPPEHRPPPGTHERKTDNPVLGSLMFGAMVADRLGAGTSFVRAMYYAVPARLRPTRGRIGVYAMAAWLFHHLDFIDQRAFAANLVKRKVTRSLAGAWWRAFSGAVVGLSGGGAHGWAVYHSVATLLDLAHHGEIGQSISARRASRARSRAALARKRRRRRP